MATDDEKEETITAKSAALAVILSEATAYVPLREGSNSKNRFFAKEAQNDQIPYEPGMVGTDGSWQSAAFLVCKMKSRSPYFARDDGIKDRSPVGAKHSKRMALKWDRIFVEMLRPYD